MQYLTRVIGLLALTPFIFYSAPGFGSTLQSNIAPENSHLLLCVVRPKSLPLTKNDPILKLEDLIQTNLLNKSNYDVKIYHLYSPEVQKAIQSGAIPMNSLIPRVNLDAIEKLATVLKMNHILYVVPTPNRNSTTYKCTFAELVGPNLWTSLSINTFVINLTNVDSHIPSAKLPDYLLAEAADEIDSIAGYPSHYQDLLSTTSSKNTTVDNTQIKNKPSAPSSIESSSTLSLSMRPPTITPPADPQYLSRAMRDKSEHRYLDEIALLLQAVDSSPYDPKLRIDLIDAYVNANMLDLATSEAQSAGLLFPANVDLMLVNAKTTLAQGNASNAVEIYSNLLKTHPNNVSILLALGDAYTIQVHYNHAIQTYQDAETLNPDLPEPHLKLATLYLLLADSQKAYYAQAVSELKLAASLEKDPTIELNDSITVLNTINNRIQTMLENLERIDASAESGEMTRGVASGAVSDLSTRVNAISSFIGGLDLQDSLQTPQAYLIQASALLMQAIGVLKQALGTASSSLTGISVKLSVFQKEINQELINSTQKISSVKGNN